MAWHISFHCSDVDIQVDDNQDGTFTCYYTVKDAGEYTLSIKFGGQPVPEGFYTFTVRICMQQNCTSRLRSQTEHYTHCTSFPLNCYSGQRRGTKPCTWDRVEFHWEIYVRFKYADFTKVAKIGPVPLHRKVLGCECETLMSDFLKGSMNPWNETVPKGYLTCKKPFVTTLERIMRVKPIPVSLSLLFAERRENEKWDA